MPSDFINGRCMIDVLDEALDTAEDNGKKWFATIDIESQTVLD